MLQEARMGKNFCKGPSVPTGVTQNKKKYENNQTHASNQSKIVKKNINLS